MTIEVEDVWEERLGATEVGIESTQATTQASAVPEEAERPKNRAHGRPPGSKNRPKAPAEEEEEEVIVKRKPKKVVYISESEDEQVTPPPSPGTQRKNEWAAYRQKQINAHQARTAHYTKSLDKMLAF